jgi:hypothetical protein
MIIGGIASIARGVPRLTKDVDATIVGEGTDLDGLVATLARHGIVPRIEGAVAFARANQVLLLTHEASEVDVDLSLAWLPFELEAIEAAEVVSIHGTRVRLPRAEDLVMYKIAAWRPQDQQDVEQLVALHGVGMDLERVRRFTREVASMLEEPERVTEVEKVLLRPWPGEKPSPKKPSRPRKAAPAPARKKSRKA